ncbi:TPA: hypothetical protein DIV49_01595 [Candidatus Saccharibacteria bacterium]|nr:hypothetical protein [Candidatus Saccharibacteria bacterium]HRJ91193.1 hypothetical protein [Candidatus Saccharibacteria bacterium]
MPSTDSLLKQLKESYPQLSFTEADDFQWLPTTHTIAYPASDDSFDARLLHEVSHALLEHHDYTRDVDLIAMERDAWQYARSTLAPRFEVTITADNIQDDMDTYREWLHARSTCPKCGANGLQTKQWHYRCLSCANIWKVNEARSCALRRYNIQK